MDVRFQGPRIGRFASMKGFAMKTILAAAILTLVAACSSPSSNPTGSGALSVSLSVPASNGTNPSLASAPEDVTSVIVSVTKVRAHVESAGWILLSDAPVVMDLLALPSAGQALGLARLPAGKVTQLRLLVAETGNYVQTKDGAAVHQYPLDVPSGIESGIKISGPWEISPCNETALSIELEGKKAVWYHPTGHGSPWILRPVVHVKRVRYAPTSCEGGEPTCVATSCPSGICDETGACAPSGAEGACTTGEECLSGVCTEALVCEHGGAGDPCREGPDCASDVCAVDGTCTDPGAGGAGSTCTSGTACLSRACQEDGTCAPGAQGAACREDADCQTDLSLYCTEGYCLER